MVVSLICAGLAGLCLAAAAQETISLPPPRKEGGAPLLATLRNRKSGRAFSGRELPLGMLSSLLWAADGINRPDGRRTAPTGLNVQDISLYVVLQQGTYLYDPVNHALLLREAGDHRALAGTQPFPQTAPVNLFFVQDMEKTLGKNDSEKAMYGGIHTGAVMQNVYLFCASEGLSCVARASIDRNALGKALRLSPTQKIVLGETVGFPKEK